MNKILFLFFTFSGICTAFAQKPGPISSPDSSGKKIPVTNHVVGNDSLPGKDKPLIRLFPNPARNRVEIELKGFERGFVQVKLMDNNKILLRDDKRLLVSNNENIVVMFSFPPGIYFVSVKQNEKMVRSKLIIQ